MIRKPAFVFFFCATAALFAAENTDQLQATHTERVSLDPGATIRVEGSYGNLNVEAWDEPEGEITWTKRMPFNYKRKQPDEAQIHLDRVQVVTRRVSGAELTISTIVPSRHKPFAGGENFDPTSVVLGSKDTGGVLIDYEIHAPRDSKLVIHHGTGEVFVSDMTGDIEATGGRGDIVLMLPGAGAYTFDAKTKFGTVISAFDGDPRLRRYRLGEYYAVASPVSSRRIYLRMGFGGITIKADPEESYGARAAK